MKTILVMFALLLTVSLAPSCARESVREERTVTAPTSTTPASSSTTIIERETVVEDEHTTVLGTIFDVVGEVLALPFRLVAGIFRFIF